MKKLITSLLIMLMILSTGLAFAACKKDAEEPKADEQTEEKADKDADESEEAAPQPGVVKTIEPDAEETLGHNLPMQISAIYLFKDGSVSITLTDDLLKNELGDSKSKELMPFSESGVVEEIGVYNIGNGGFRTVVALMDDGTISAINTRALMEDHIIAVMDNIGGRDNFTSIEQQEGEDGFSIIGKTKEGEDVILDPVLLTENGEVEPIG